MTTSGRAAATAARKAPASNASATTPRAPSASISEILAAERVVPVTAWPAPRRSFNNGRPITPVAPATNTFIANPSRHCRVDLRGVVVLEILHRLAIGEAPGIRLVRPHHLARLLVAPGAAPEHD